MKIFNLIFVFAALSEGADIATLIKHSREKLFLANRRQSRRFLYRGRNLGVEKEALRLKEKIRNESKKYFSQAAVNLRGREGHILSLYKLYATHYSTKLQYNYLNRQLLARQAFHDPDRFTL